LLQKRGNVRGAVTLMESRAASSLV
jgi:hypothetical protein